MEHMAIDPQREVGDGPADGEASAPSMLSRPADPPPALPHLTDSEPLRALREARQHRFSDETGRPLRVRLRTWASHVTGRSDRRLVQALTDATDTMTARCDQLADRILALEAVSAEVAEVLGREVTLLRAEVERLRESNTASHPPHE